MVPMIQSCIPREERESLQSTGRRLNRCEGTTTQSGRMDSPRSSGFILDVKRMSYGSSYVQVLGFGSMFKGRSYCKQCDGTR
jgi:hypothetical protein